MNSESGGELPLIIKRKKVVKGDGHHGGAWKVAYADFVTAMMAFFLLMWLLNATTEDQRKGIADYFNPTIPLSRISGGGSDGLNGSSIFTEQTYARMGMGGSQRKTVEHKDGGGQEDQEKEAGGVSEAFESLQVEMSNQDSDLSQHISVRMSPEGIVLEIADTESNGLFMTGSSAPTPLLEELLTIVNGSMGKFQNNLKIVGHTDNVQYRDDATYNNWDLSVDRANAARRLLIEAGLPYARIQEVSGKAYTQPLIEDDPSAPQNRRISITILTQ